MVRYSVRVPATSANCGPGFDSLGVALTLYNTFTFTPMEGEVLRCRFTGWGAETLQEEHATENPILSAMYVLAHHAGRTLPGGIIDVQIDIPPARGLGSSATAVVGGLLLADAYLGTSYTRTQLLALATACEGHPDNVAPALLGGFCIAAQADEEVPALSIPVPSSLRFVIAVPSHPLVTQEARSVLPTQLSYEDTVFSLSRAALLVGAISTERWDILRHALQDRLHVPYRLPLIAGGHALLTAAQEAGAYGATISGSGSTLIAFVPAEGVVAQEVAEAMRTAYSSYEGHLSLLVLDADATGAQCSPYA